MRLLPFIFLTVPLVWMLHSQKLYDRINKCQERTLRIVHIDYKSTFDELLSKDNSLTMHHCNLQQLATKVFKVKIIVAPVLTEAAL